MGRIVAEVPDHSFQLEEEKGVVDIDGVLFKKLNKTPSAGDTVIIKRVYREDWIYGDWIREVKAIVVDQDTGDLVFHLNHPIKGGHKVEELEIEWVLKKVQSFKKERISSYYQELVESAKEVFTMQRVLKELFEGCFGESPYSELKNLSAEQLTQAWWGIAEITPDYITPEEAYKHLLEGNKFLYDDNGVTGEEGNIDSLDPKSIRKYNRNFYMKD